MEGVFTLERDRPIDGGVSHTERPIHSLPDPTPSPQRRKVGVQRVKNPQGLYPSPNTTTSLTRPDPRETPEVLYNNTSDPVRPDPTPTRPLLPTRVDPRASPRGERPRDRDRD